MSQQILNVGKCTKCGNLVDARENCSKCRALSSVTDPQYQHTGDELRMIADLLDLLNKRGPDLDAVGFEGELKLYWCDRVMGVVRQDDPPDRESWVYMPTAQAENLTPDHPPT